jgi:hypothetical protein
MEKITLKCGTRMLRMEKLLVRRTYEGLLEGRPGEAENARFVGQFTGWVKQTTQNEMPHVVEPTIDRSNGYPLLPDYSCAVELTSFQAAHDKSADMSYSVLVWFQSKNPLLGCAGLFELLKELRWSDIAQDGGW